MSKNSEPANILTAITNFNSLDSHELKLSSKSSNRINSVGDSLESFVMNLFCSSLNEKLTSDEVKLIYNQKLSYIGNQNNPPDFMIKGGDAIEVRKTNRVSSSIKLYSSAPRNKLHVDDPKITKACKNAESWKEKDIIYAFGTMKRKQITNLFMTYGECFIADREIYQNHIKSKVDPLGLTKSKRHNSWVIKNPYRVFSGKISKERLFNIIMLESKYESFSKSHKSKITNIKAVKIPDPNNPSASLDAINIWGKELRSD